MIKNVKFTKNVHLYLHMWKSQKSFGSHITQIVNVKMSSYCVKTKLHNNYIYTKWHNIHLLLLMHILLDINIDDIFQRLTQKFLMIMMMNITPTQHQLSLQRTFNAPCIDAHVTKDNALKTALADSECNIILNK